jgi:hypothetical protein
MWGNERGEMKQREALVEQRSNLIPRNTAGRIQPWQYRSFGIWTEVYMYHAIVRRICPTKLSTSESEELRCDPGELFPPIFIIGLAGITHWVVSGMIVTRWGDGLNAWAGWPPRCNSQFMMYG